MEKKEWHEPQLKRLDVLLTECDPSGYDDDGGWDWPRHRPRPRPGHGWWL